MKPLKPTATQMNRVLSGGIGDGFFVYKRDIGIVEVVEFRVKPDGTLWIIDMDTNEESLLRYYSESGELLVEAYRVKG